MPVTTRSQAKLLTGSNTALSQNISTGSPELSDTLFNSASQQSNNHPHSPVNLLMQLTSSVVLPSINHHCSSCEDDFEILASTNNNFEISNSQPFEISKTSSNFSSSNLSHNFENPQIHSMEAGYKEPSSTTMASSDNIDITKLFAALSSQISVQKSNLQDQLM
jgi:hypothetical protein